jgi:hypothetical protein
VNASGCRTRHSTITHRTLGATIVSRCGVYQQEAHQVAYKWQRCDGLILLLEGARRALALTAGVAVCSNGQVECIMNETFRLRR